jgi:hypothetical protein
MKGIKVDNKLAAKIIASYALTNSYLRTGKELGVCNNTVKRVINRKNKEDPEMVSRIVKDKKDTFIEDATRIMSKAMKRLENELDSPTTIIPTNNLSTVIGTLYDKRALAKGESTSNTNGTISVVMSDELKELSK